MESDARKITSWFDNLANGEFKPQFGRMDEDFDVWEMNPSPSNWTGYESDIRAKTKSHPSEIIVISDELRLNSDNVQSILSSADIQITVKMAEAEGIDKRAEVGKLERLFYYMLEQGDLRLRRLLLPSLRECSDWHALIRGWRAARILNYRLGDQIIADYMPLDPRYLVYEVGGEGLIKVGYKTFKSKAALESEWGVQINGSPWYKPWEKSEKDIAVIDYWESEGTGKFGNAVLTKDKFLKEPEILEMRSMPFSIIPISTRPPISDDAGTKLKGYGESIFAPNRNINAVRNRFISMEINHANLLANLPVINYIGEGGRSVPPNALFSVPNTIIELTKGENELASPPLKEISPTMVNILGWLNSQVQSTLLPPFQLEQPPASGTRYALAAEASNKVFNPQLRSLEHFLEDICRLIEEQLVDGGVRVEKKKPISQIKFHSFYKKEYAVITVKPVDLKKDHIIKVEATASNPWEKMDTAQQAQMLQALGLPRAWIYEHILKIQDPKLIDDLRALEVYEMSPIEMMKKAAKMLMDMGYKDEAWKLIEKMDMLEAQERAAAIGTPEGTTPISSPPPLEPGPPLEPRPPVMPPMEGL